MTETGHFFIIFDISYWEAINETDLQSGTWHEDAQMTRLGIYGKLPQRNAFSRLFFAQTMFTDARRNFYVISFSNNAIKNISLFLLQKTI